MWSCDVLHKNSLQTFEDIIDELMWGIVGPLSRRLHYAVHPVYPSVYLSVIPSRVCT